MDYFLKIDGIMGEALDSKHKGEIELESFAWGETHELAAAGGGGGGGAGRVRIEDVHFAMKFNRASPLLLLACASGQHLKSAVLTARREGKDALEFLVYKFNDLLVSSYRTTASPEQPYPLDEVAFNFGQVQVEYRPQRPDGRPDAPVQAGWDVRANRKI